MHVSDNASSDLIHTHTRTCTCTQLTRCSSPRPPPTPPHSHHFLILSCLDSLYQQTDTLPLLPPLPLVPVLYCPVLYRPVYCVLQEAVFPLYDQVKAEHVVPGMRALLKQLHAEIDALEASGVFFFWKGGGRKGGGRGNAVGGWSWVGTGGGGRTGRDGQGCRRRETAGEEGGGILQWSVQTSVGSAAVLEVCVVCLGCLAASSDGACVVLAAVT